MPSVESYSSSDSDTSSQVSTIPRGLDDDDKRFLIVDVERAGGFASVSLDRILSKPENFTRYRLDLVKGPKGLTLTREGQLRKRQFQNLFNAYRVKYLDGSFYSTVRQKLFPAANVVPTVVPPVAEPEPPKKKAPPTMSNNYDPERYAKASSAELRHLVANFTPGK